MRSSPQFHAAVGSLAVGRPRRNDPSRSVQRGLSDEPRQGCAVRDHRCPEDGAERLLDRLVPESVTRDQGPWPTAQESHGVEGGLGRTPPALFRRRLVSAVSEDSDAAEQAVGDQHQNGQLLQHNEAAQEAKEQRRDGESSGRATAGRSPSRYGRQVLHLRCARPIALVSLLGVGDLATNAWPPPMWERTHVDEHARTTGGRGDETEAPLVVPVCVDRCRWGLLSRRSGLLRAVQER